MAEGSEKRDPSLYMIDDWAAERLTAVTFAKGEPPVRGFWSLTLYDAQHFFVPNEIKRFSIGTRRTRTLQPIRTRQ